MANPFNLKSGSLFALAAGLAFAGIPAAAQAQEDRGRWQGGSRGEAGAERTERSTRGGDSGWRAERGDRAQRSVAAPQQVPQAQVRAAPQAQVRAAPQAQAQWQGRNPEQGRNTEARPGTRTRGDAAGGGWTGRTRTETRAANTGWQGSRSVDVQRSTADTAVRRQESGRTWASSNDDSRRREAVRGDDYRRGEGWRGSDSRRTETRRDDDRRREGWRDDNRRRDEYRSDYRSGYRDARRDWNRDWRRDNRYNWTSYRASNRHHYRLGSYYAPYRNYSYRRLSIGFSLDSLFFSSRYWISDPWSYRLPPVDGPYRWVRYYDDVLLVDIYSGEVVDVIHNFFW